MREQEPGVKLQVMMTVFSPSQLECSLITCACVQMSYDQQDKVDDKGDQHTKPLLEM